MKNGIASSIAALCVILATGTTRGAEPRHSTYSFQFNTGADGWQFYSPVGFDVSTAEFNGTKLGLDVTPGSNANSFAFWESPVFSLYSPPPPAKNERGVVDRLFRGIITISNGNIDPLKLPTLRFRAATEDFSQTAAYVVNSMGDLRGLPLKNGSLNYRVFLYLPPGTENIVMDWDVLNFDPSDLPHTTLTMTNAGVSGVDPATFGEISETTTFDFTTGTHGFEERSAEPTFAAPQFLHSPTLGLGMRQNPAKPVGASPIDFGFWSKEQVITYSSDSIYKISWTIASEAEQSQIAQVPVFRMRVNSGNLQFSAFLNVDSRDTNSIIPYKDNPRTYDLWFRPQAEVPSDTMILSFDFLATGADGNDATIPVYVRDITINRIIF